MIEKIKHLLSEAENLQAHNAEELESLRLKYLSKKGLVNQLMADFRNVPAEQKREVGILINRAKDALTARFADLKAALATTDDDHSDLDLTRTPYPIRLGTRHPLSIVTHEIVDIFSRMGFILADGPEVEDDLHVFTKMNFAEQRVVSVANVVNLFFRNLFHCVYLFYFC